MIYSNSINELAHYTIRTISRPKYGTAVIRELKPNKSVMITSVKNASDIYKFKRESASIILEFFLPD